MRGSILLWSTLSGVLLGLLADALLVGVWVILTSFVHTLTSRFGGRAAALMTVAALALPPLLGGILGYLEGQLKTR